MAARDRDIHAAVKRAGELRPVAFKLCEGYWAVQSTSEPGRGYMIEVHAGKVHCECPGFEHRGVCVHSVTVAIEEGLLPLRFLLGEVREVEPAPVRIGGLHGRRTLYGEGA